MRIGIDIRSLLEQEAGGVSAYTEKILTNLFRIDTQNEYLLFYNSFQKNLPSKNKEELSAPNVTLKPFSFPNKIFNISLNFFKYPKIDKLIGGVDLFFVPNLIFIALSSQVKKVITLHDLSFLLYPHFYSSKGRLWHRAISPKKLVKEFDKIIAVSENTRQDTINFFQLDPEKVVTIHSGIDQETDQDSSPTFKDKVRLRYRLPEKFILSLCALEPRKNVETIVSAFELFKEHYPNPYRLVIAGASRDRSKELRSLLKKSKFQNDIHFLGYISNEEKPLLYQMADLFVYPSFYEGFGFPPLEAMAASLPVIASYSSSLSEVCEDAAILVNPYDIEELTESFQQVLFNPELSGNLIKKGLNQVKKFSWQKTAKETLNLFNSLVNEE